MINGELRFFIFHFASLGKRRIILFFNIKERSIFN